MIQANYFNVKTVLRSIPPSDRCAPGKYMDVSGRGSSAAQPQCKTCAPGFFKSVTSNIVSCTAHTKCPPGKHTIVSGSATAQPQCQKCAVGFYKSITSESSTCPGRLGSFYVQMTLFEYSIIVRTCKRMHNSYYILHCLDVCVVVRSLCGRLWMNIVLKILATLDGR